MKKIWGQWNKIKPHTLILGATNNDFVIEKDWIERCLEKHML